MFPEKTGVAGAKWKTERDEVTRSKPQGATAMYGFIFW